MGVCVTSETAEETIITKRLNRGGHTTSLIPQIATIFSME